MLQPRRWVFKTDGVEAPSAGLIEAAQGSPVLARLLMLRGISDPAVATVFLNPNRYTPTPPEHFPGMTETVARITQAIHAQETILVYGDFDVDGVTGTAILMQALRTLGAKAVFYIPSRHTEGHGLHAASLCRLVSARQVKLVITTDTGSSNFNEVSLLNGLGVDTLITDHHELPEHLPRALAVLNPKLLPPDSPLAPLCGAGVAYKLCEALYETFSRPESDREALLDLVAIGTVVDMVPLIRENRYLVWQGLQIMQTTRRLGLQALLEAAGSDPMAPVTSQTLGFVIGPRLNAIGRLSQADDAVNLLLSEDPEQARALAAKLEQLNRRRKDLVSECLLQAESHLQSTGELSDQKAIIMASPDWNAGIVGLVATKLIDRYYRPAFLGMVDADTQEVRFSARSIPGFHMHRQLQTLEDLFLRWGGHEGAAGFVIAQKQLPQLKQRLHQLCQTQITEDQLIPMTAIDMALTPDQVNPYLVDLVNAMAPFGQDNPLPTFALEHMTLATHRWMGDQQQHLKLIFNTPDPGQYLEALTWNWPGNKPRFDRQTTYRLAFQADLNTYNGVTRLQLQLQDLQRQDTAAPIDLPMPSPRPEVATAPPPAPPPGTRSQPGPIWLDHRGRENLDSFIPVIWGANLPDLSPADDRIFAEGTQTGFPLPLEARFFCTRQDLAGSAPVQNLLLWDLPPDKTLLADLVHHLAPARIHLIGGKYQKIPLNRPPKTFLEGTVSLLRRLSQASPSGGLSVSPTDLARMLSTTLPVTLNALSVLARMGILTTRIHSDGDTLAVDWVDATPALEAMPVAEWVEYAAFCQALAEVHQFRQWLMTAPLPMIQSQGGAVSLPNGGARSSSVVADEVPDAVHVVH